MLQPIIIIVIVGAAAGYLVYSLRRSLTRPDCGCGHESECPYNRKFPGPGECPMKENDAKDREEK
ncbi:MAG TPA: hypothetical protein VM658_00205 [bacterium]|nr:hypothetical protein [bacterium]